MTDFRNKLIQTTLEKQSADARAVNEKLERELAENKREQDAVINEHLPYVKERCEAAAASGKFRLQIATLKRGRDYGDVRGQQLDPYDLKEGMRKVYNYINELGLTAILEYDYDDGGQSSWFNLVAAWN